jgi:tetratricopeptide (TPR) repeat protein
VFGIVKEWLERRETLRELRAIEVDSKPYSAFFTEQIELALKEFSHQRPQKALEIWRRMHAQFPDLCLKTEKALNLFIDIGRHDEAEALIQDGLRRYPRSRSLYETASARVAYRRGDLEEALRRYDAVRRRFPQVADGYGIAAACLTALGRADEAESMLERGIRKLADNYDLSVRHAQAAVHRRDWAAALTRWKSIADGFPHLPGPLGVAQSLKEMGRLDEAEDVLIEASERFTSNPYPFVDLAGLAIAKGDLDEAIRRWKVVLDRFPWFDRAYTECAAFMCKVGRDVEADELLCLVVGRSPEYLPGYLEYARSAQRRGDWPAAAERWAMVKARFPECTEAVEGEALALESVKRQSDPADH